MVVGSAGSLVGKNNGINAVSEDARVINHGLVEGNIGVELFGNSASLLNNGTIIS